MLDIDGPSYHHAYSIKDAGIDLDQLETYTSTPEPVSAHLTLKDQTPSPGPMISCGGQFAPQPVVRKEEAVIMKQAPLTKQIPKIALNFTKWKLQ